MPKKQPPRPSRLMASESPLSGAPWWVKAGAYVGAPAVILGFVMYWQRQDAVEDRAEMRKQIQTIASQMDTHVKDGGAFFQVMQRVCINTSKTDQDRLACVTIHKDLP